MHPAAPQVNAPIDDAPPLRLVFWETTQACNLACRHCRAEAKTYRDPAELSGAEALGMMDAMARLGRPVLVFSGGEPLMRPDLFDLMGGARERGLPFALSTNGTLLDDETAGRVAATGVHRVSVSLDGPDASTHDAFRQQSGAFEATLAGVRRLRRLGVPVQVNTSVTTHNNDRLDEILKLVRSEDCQAWHLFMLVPVGCGLTIPDGQRLAAGAYERTLRWFVQAQARSPLEMKATCAPHVVRIARQLFPAASTRGGGRAQTGPGARHAPSAHPSSGAGKGCLAGRGICFVSRFGEVRGCGYLPLAAGSLRERPLDGIWRDSELFRRLRNPGSLSGKCGACEYVEDCMGCRARAYSATGDAFAEEPHCAWVPAAARPRRAPVTA